MDATTRNMSITIKTEAEIEKMRVAGRLAAEVLEMIEPHVQPGVTTDELDRICHDFIVGEQRAIPAPLDLHLRQQPGLSRHSGQ
jgi:methionine aminopeptidase